MPAADVPFGSEELLPSPPQLWVLPLCEEGWYGLLVQTSPQHFKAQRCLRGTGVFLRWDLDVVFPAPSPRPLLLGSSPHITDTAAPLLLPKFPPSTFPGLLDTAVHTEHSHGACHALRQPHSVQPTHWPLPQSLPLAGACRPPHTALAAIPPLQAPCLLCPLGRELFTTSINLLEIRKTL